MQRVFARLVLPSVVGLACLLVGPAAHAASPTMVTVPGSSGACGVPGLDLCVPGADVFVNFPPAVPGVFPGGPAYGLLPGDVINAFSFGLDTHFGGEPVFVSVDAATVGLAGAVVVEAGAGEAQADVYGVGVVGAPAINFLAIDGDGAPAAAPPASGLVEAPAAPPVDDLNGLAACDAGTGPLFLGGAMFFTLAPGSPTLGVLGAGPADILVAPVGGPVGVFIPGPAIGLVPGDVIDALSMDAGTPFAMFSLAPGSPTLGLLVATPADILVPGPAVAVAAGAMGFGVFDNVDAIDVMAADADGDLVNDLCDNCPGVFNNAQLDFDADGMGDACDPPPTPTSTDTPTPADTPTPTSTPTPDAGCPVSPLVGCDAPAKSILKLKDRDADGPGPKDQILWKYIKGPAELQTGFGDPTSTASYRLCVYDASGLAIQADVAAAGTCGTKDCWKALGSKGYKFLDKTSAQDGFFKVILKGNATDPKTKILVKGKDGALTYSAANPLLDASGTISVRLTNTDNANCWGADFAPAEVIKNTDALFKAKTP